METEKILIVLLLTSAPVAYLAGYYHRRRDAYERLMRLRDECRERRYAYLMRLQEHQMNWKKWSEAQ